MLVSVRGMIHPIIFWVSLYFYSAILTDFAWLICYVTYCSGCQVIFGSFSLGFCKLKYLAVTGVFKFAFVGLYI